MSSYNRILGYDLQRGSWQNLACNSTGALYVTGISGSGSGGDASAANQQLQLNQATASNTAIFNQLETQTDRILYDTDIIANRLYDIKGNVSILNQISGFATSAKQDSILSDLDQFKFTGDKLQVETISGFATLALQESSNTAQYGKLSTIAEASEISSSYLQGILTKATGLQHQSTKYTLSAVSSLAPDTTPAFTQPPAGSGLDGWYFKNVALSQPSQIYYYSYVNPSQQVPARQKTYTIGDISGGYCVVNMLSVNATAGLVMLAIYSQPTGSGDAGPGFFKSRKVYTIPTGAELTQGMTVLLYWGLAPDSRLFPDVKRIECTLTSSIGPCLNTENLAFLTLNTDSSALVGNSDYIVSHAGWIYGAEHIHNTQFTAESDAVAAGDASAANQQLQLTQSQESNTAICARLDKNVYTASNLHVYDSRATAQLVDCVSQLSGINGVLNDFADGTQQMYVTLSGSDDSVSVMGYNEGLSMPQTITLTASSGMRSLDVHVANQPSGYATESSLSGINDLITNQSAFSRFQTETPVSDQKLDTIITNMSLTSFNINGLSTCNTNDVYISNFPSTQGVSLQGETISASVSGTVSVDNHPTQIQVVNDPGNSLSVGVSGFADVKNYGYVSGEDIWIGLEASSSGVLKTDTTITNTSINSHIYGSPDGNTWHHIKTNPNGVVSTNAIMETDAHGSLTSENKIGTGAYNALHCWVKNSIVLDPNSSTNITALDPISTKSQSSQNTEIAVDIVVNGPVSIGVADTDGYLWISAQIQINECTSGGMLYLEYSGEGAIWFRGNASGESVYVNPSVTQQRVLIRPQTPTTMRYVRVFAESTFAGTGVSAWVSMK